MLTKKLIPQFAPCVNCGHEYSGAVCPICKTDHPTLAALKNIGKQNEPSILTVRLAGETC